MSPAAIRVSVAGVPVTSTVAVPVTPFFALAEIVACPGATPVTLPVAPTDATPGALELQVTCGLVIVCPASLSAVAASCTTPATGMLDVAGVTVTDTMA